MIYLQSKIKKKHIVYMTKQLLPRENVVAICKRKQSHYNLFICFSYFSLCSLWKTAEYTNSTLQNAYLHLN